MTHVFKHPKYWREMRKELQASSDKRQAASFKRQAPSANELDRDPGLGYNGINKTKPPLKVSAMSAVSKAGTFRAVSPRIHAVTIKDSTVGPCTCPAASSPTTSSQDEERKPASPEPRVQASSPRTSVPGSGNQGTSESAQASGNKHKE